MTAQDAEFLDRLVHDLREPLRSIGAFSELLGEIANGRFDAEGDRVLSEIRSGATRLGTLLDGLSGYSTALRGSAIQSRGTSSLPAALKIVVANMADQIRMNGATITGVEVTGGELPRLAIGLEPLMQLLENLIGNSLRFRSEAAPVIRIAAAPDNAVAWAIRVEDNGIGIAPDDYEAVFRPFKRVAGKKYPGSGLGLTICKAIVETHGGTIRMASAPGGGAVCTFTLAAA
ncbi:MAG TPA: ATP-binding protein [Bryobacteraceae bacterium]